MSTDFIGSKCRKNWKSIGIFVTSLVLAIVKVFLSHLGHIFSIFHLMSVLKVIYILPIPPAPYHKALNIVVRQPDYPPNTIVAQHATFYYNKKERKNERGRVPWCERSKSRVSITRRAVIKIYKIHLHAYRNTHKQIRISFDEYALYSLKLKLIIIGVNSILSCVCVIPTNVAVKTPMSLDTSCVSSWLLLYIQQLSCTAIL